MLDLFLCLACMGVFAGGEGFPREARWIAYPYERAMGNFDGPVCPVPVFRTAFDVKADVAEAKLRICGLGFYVFELDGRRVDDARLVPAPTAYDRRFRYRVHRLGRLAAGRHVLSVTVGDGFYRNGHHDYWHFEKASWTDYPKLAAELVDDGGATILKTGPDWKVRFSAIRSTKFRAGEDYDARLEFPALETEGPDWKPARIVPGPGGFAQEETFPPCRVIAEYPMAKLDGTNVWFAPCNISGVPRIRVKGEAGAKVTLLCGEYRLRRQGGSSAVVTNHVAYGERLQTDTYVLRGGGEEVWAPEFTYHGFDRIQAAVEGRVDVLGIDALEIHTAFRRVGSLETSDRMLARIAEAGLRSVLNNFVGIPTDCPHREKNGWTSEARLQCETLLYAWDASGAYLGYVDDIVDAQRPSGQLPGMLPTGGVGYNWGSGPAWDAALACIPESVARFTGDRSAFDRYRPAINRYCDYVKTLLGDDGLCTFGLGDWCRAPFGRAAPTPFVTTAFCVRCFDLVGRRAEAAALRAAILKKYYRGNGVFSVAASVMPALALEFALVPEGERMACAEELARIVTANQAKVDYGTIGSGCVLRALLEAGYADLAYRMMTQPEMPGYAYWFNELDMTTFPESWDPYRTSSGNHGAFCDIVACMYRYFAGFRHVAARPGRNFLEVRPVFPSQLCDFAADHDGYRVAWKRTGDRIDFTLVVPAGASASLVLPGFAPELLKEGTFTREVIAKPLEEPMK